MPVFKESIEWGNQGKNTRGWRLPWKLRSKCYGNIREHFEWAKLKLRLFIILHLALFRLYRKVAKPMQGVPLPGFGAGALTRELQDWRSGRHRKADSDSLGSPMNKLQSPGGTVGLLHTVEQGGRFIARGRVYGIYWTRRQVFLISVGVVSAGEKSWGGQKLQPPFSARAINIHI